MYIYNNVGMRVSFSDQLVTLTIKHTYEHLFQYYCLKSRSI